MAEVVGRKGANYLERAVRGPAGPGGPALRVHAAPRANFGPPTPGPEQKLHSSLILYINELIPLRQAALLSDGWYPLLLPHWAVSRDARVTRQHVRTFLCRAYERCKVGAESDPSERRPKTELMPRVRGCMKHDTTPPRPPAEQTVAEESAASPVGVCVRRPFIAADQ
ncbi:hypothetical protein EVAR_15652_1 [Eumeta japonica]|uniref:Uncharacterized protein n=1 Tax=Eumeta variegata TaxID=151549 RepID=A0A4C1U9J9_EUMVA|nr:hypothetical protein EVAR_15652_1 [Eumeta japonica]